MDIGAAFEPLQSARVDIPWDKLYVTATNSTIRRLGSKYGRPGGALANHCNQTLDYDCILRFSLEKPLMRNTSTTASGSKLWMNPKYP